MNEHDEYETHAQQMKLMQAKIKHLQEQIDILQNYIFQLCPDLSKEKLKRKK